jgi:hypothetical protein
MTNRIEITEHAESLLSIDVDAQIRKISGAALQDDSDAIANIFRLMIRHGATRIECTSSRHSIAIWASACTLPQTLLDAYGALVHVATPNHTRQRALALLEAQGGQALMTLLHSNFSDVALGSGKRAEGKRRHSVPVGASEERVEHSGFSISWRSATPITREVVRKVQDRSRFAPISIVLDGQPAPRGFAHALASLDLRPSFDMLLAIHGRNETGRVWLIHDGIVIGHQTWPDLPWIEGVVPIAFDDPVLGREWAEHMREHALPQAKALLLQTLGHASTLAPTIRTKLIRAALTFNLNANEFDQLSRLSLFATYRPWRVDRSADELHWISLRDLEALARPRDGMPSVYCLGPDQRIENYARRDPVVIVDSAVRACLRERISFSFALPPLRRASYAWFDPRSWLEAWRLRPWLVPRLLANLSAKTFGIFSRLHREPIAASHAEVRQELVATRSFVESRFSATATVIWARGDYPPRWRNGSLYLCENHPPTRRILETLRTQPWALEAALLALAPADHPIELATPMS